MSAPALGAADGRARLGRYVPYLLRDYVMQGGIAFLIIAFFLAGFPIIVESYSRPDGWLGSGDAQELSTAVLRGVVPNLLFLGALLAVNAVVSNDRRLGYFRFLFAKPLSMSAYYLTAWAVRGAGFVALTALLATLWRFLVAPIAVGDVAAAAALEFAVLGGLGFFLSALVRQDWLMTAGVWVAANVAQAIVARSGWTGLRRTVAEVVIPPAEPLTGATNALLSGLPLPDGVLVHLLAFAAACLLLGIYVLRRRPLAT